MANIVLNVLYLLALALYAWARPSWRNIGPSLLDSFVIGIALYSLGAVLVWQLRPIADGPALARIALVAGIAATSGAALWGRTFRTSIKPMNFLGMTGALSAGSGERFAITAGLAISAAVALWFLVEVYSNDNFRALLYAAITQQSATFTDVRLGLSAGVEGYFAPGYVKQFRDILIPILCAAALLCHGAYRNRPIFYGALVVASIAMFVSGQRLVIITLMLCLGTALVLILVVHGRSRLMPIAAAIPSFVAMAGVVLLMTQMLGRVESKLAIVRIDAPPVPCQATAPARCPPAKVEDGSVTRTAAGALAAIVDRAIAAAPLENALTYKRWAGQAPTWGAGWATELAGVRPGTQRQPSNELAGSKAGTSLGNSPLGLPADLYHNWGWAGLVFFCLLYPLLFLRLDMVLTGSRSPLLLAAKIFLFFSVPVMYSPFLFILYGGAVVLALALYVALLRRGALSFLGLREGAA